MRMTHPSRVGFVLNGEWTDALATAVEEFVRDNYVYAPLAEAVSTIEVDAASARVSALAQRIREQLDAIVETESFRRSNIEKMVIGIVSPPRLTTVDGCPTCGGKWTASGQLAPTVGTVVSHGELSGVNREGNVAPLRCGDPWHVDNYPLGRRGGF